jgi:hypothetical protein
MFVVEIPVMINRQFSINARLPAFTGIRSAAANSQGSWADSEKKQAVETESQGFFFPGWCLRVLV